MNEFLFPRRKLNQNNEMKILTIDLQIMALLLNFHHQIYIILHSMMELIEPIVHDCLTKQKELKCVILN